MAASHFVEVTDKEIPQKTCVKILKQLFGAKNIYLVSVNIPR
jgi:hypothetical protein